jgi:hypothetical protein
LISQEQEGLSDTDRTLAVISQLWKCDFERLSPSVRVDYAVTTKDGLMAYAEVFNEPNPINSRPFWPVPMDKWLRTKYLSEASNGVPMMFIVHWPEGIHWIRQDAATHRVVLSPPGVRSDIKNWELCVHLDTKQFRLLQT